MNVRSMGLGDALGDQIIQYQKALHDLAVSIDLATKSGQTDAATQLRQQFAALKAEIDRLIAQQKTAESPSSFMLGLDSVAATVRKYALIGGVLIGAAIILPPLLSRRKP